MLIYMEKKQILFVTAIQKRNIKKVDNGEKKVNHEREAFRAGRFYERKLLIEVLQRERQKNQNKKIGDSNAKEKGEEVKV